MADRIIRAEDNGQPLLDADGEPFTELDVDSPDELDEVGATVAELAALERDWRFGHVIVDEAQDLTPMQWRMVARRAVGGSMTIVGDLAQRSIGEPGSWSDHLPSSVGDFAYAELTVNYRSPSEISEVAARLLAELAPGLPAAQAIRSSGVAPATHALPASELSVFVAEQRRLTPEGRLAVIGFDLPTKGHGAGVVWLDPWQAKGLEFDHVVIVEPQRFLDEPRGLSLLYVAITRATHRLFFVHERPLPPILGLVHDHHS